MARPWSARCYGVARQRDGSRQNSIGGYLSFAGFGFRPPSQQQVEFFFPPDEVSQAACVHRVEKAFHRSRSQCRPGSGRS
jgi:hypothetical protein